MTTLREAAQQALAYIEKVDYGPYDNGPLKEALRAALEQEGQEQEPVAWQGVHDNTDLYYHRPPQADVRPLYTHPAAKDCGEAGHDEGRCGNASCMAHPPRREWQGLSEGEINALPEVGGVMWRMGTAPAVLRAIHAALAALKEKNNG